MPLKSGQVSFPLNHSFQSSKTNIIFTLNCTTLPAVLNSGSTSSQKSTNCCCTSSSLCSRQASVSQSSRDLWSIPKVANIPRIIRVRLDGGWTCLREHLTNQVSRRFHQLNANIKKIWYTNDCAMLNIDILKDEPHLRKINKNALPRTPRKKVLDYPS